MLKERCCRVKSKFKTFHVHDADEIGNAGPEIWVRVPIGASKEVIRAAVRKAIARDRQFRKFVWVGDTRNVA